jgi:2-oxoisovalerate dehydrogenase E1 component
VDRTLQRALLIREVEERFLALFSAGKLSGTTHTCIGQELTAVALADALDRTRDVVFSNHRCHGHYLAWTDDVGGLVAEVMGKSTGICAGLGGSQHLCGERFFSNGIQGGIVPVSAGIAMSHKLAGNGAITAVCIGDGTLGEGVLYETLNLASKWRLPLLVMLENNGYAQSTSQLETMAGDICARAAAFGIATYATDTWHQEDLFATLASAARYVREQGAPAFVRVDTYRLAAHSKSDDDRDKSEIGSFAARDPVNMLLARAGASAEIAANVARVRERVAVEIERAEEAPRPDLARLAHADHSEPAAECEWRAAPAESGTQLAALNRALGEWLSEDPRVVLIGEDVRSPYGGAFKVTRGLSAIHPERVLNTPISEAAIVGIGNGLALGGFRPVVEIMFGDFMTLCFDQLVNHAAKFNGMYDGRVTVPILVRAPMGGGRGYGPTHSQNLEKHLAGVPGLALLVLHGRTAIAGLFADLRSHQGPVVLIENKLLYRESLETALPEEFAAVATARAFPTTRLVPPGAPDLTVVAFGRMSVAVEKVAQDLAHSEEILLEVLLPLQVNPFDAAPVLESVRRTGRLLVVEEGAAGFDLASEVIAAVSIAWKGAQPLRIARVAARPVPIPSNAALELEVLPGEASIRAACLALYDV